MLKSKTYWTLLEVYCKLLDLPIEDYTPYSDDTNFSYILGSFYSRCGLNIDMSHNKEYVDNVLGLVLNRYHEHYLGYTDSDTMTLKDARKLFEKVISTLVITYPKYSTILKLYDDNMNKLMSPVRTLTHSTTRFNDTPQEEGDWSDDMHTSNITGLEGYNDADNGTKMARLKEIRDSFDNVLLMWSNEFDKILIEEGNI